MEGLSGPRTHVRRTCANICSQISANIPECSTVACEHCEHCEHARTLRTWLRTYVPRTCVREHAKSVIFVHDIRVHWHMYRQAALMSNLAGEPEWRGWGSQSSESCRTTTTYQRTWREHSANMLRTWNGVEDPIAEAQDHGRIEFLFVRQLHNLNNSRAENSSAWPFSVCVRPTVTQSQQLKRRKPKRQTKLRFLSLDSFRNWATKALKCLSETPTYDDLQKTTSREHMFSANMREHMFSEHVFANTRTQRTYVHDQAKIVVNVGTLQLNSKHAHLLSLAFHLNHMELTLSGVIAKDRLPKSLAMKHWPDGSSGWVSFSSLTVRRRCLPAL